MWLTVSIKWASKRSFSSICCNCFYIGFDTRINLLPKVHWKTNLIKNCYGIHSKLDVSKLHNSTANAPQTQRKRNANANSTVFHKEVSHPESKKVVRITRFYYLLITLNPEEIRFSGESKWKYIETLFTLLVRFQFGSILKLERMVIVITLGKLSLGLRISTKT